MSEKGFEAEYALNETPNFSGTEEKPLEFNKKQSQKVDINVLKARVKAIQNKENKKNVFIFVLTLITLAGLGIYFSI
tara:strand:+ start:202 stop:432 length:231 start_codon:yes stop_codon:yes gene_type:complete